MISHSEAQELHRLIGGPIETAADGYDGDLEVSAVMVPLKDLERARELAAVIVSDTDTDTDTDKYHWIGWESEEDEMVTDARPGTYWITICHPDGEEYAVIIHRTMGGKFPLDGDVAKGKEADAQRIVDALNRK